MKITVKHICIGLFLVGLLARVWSFAELPLSLNRDEVALAYNAYSLYQEGVDEWGQAYPVSFKSFGDYKLPGYIYQLFVLFQFLPANDVVVRLPSLLAFLAISYISFQLIREVFPTKDALAWITLPVLGLSFWSIFYSRMAYEAHVALAWQVASIFMLLHKKYWVRLLSVVPMVIAMLTYNSPLLLAVPILIFWFLLQQHTKMFSKESISVLLLHTLGIVFVGFLVLSASSAKTGITIFTDSGVLTEFRESRVALAEGYPLAAKIWYNQYFYFLREAIVNYISHFSPFFLVQQGGTHPWHSLPTKAHIGWVNYMLLLSGIGYFLYMQRVVILAHVRSIKSLLTSIRKNWEQLWLVGIFVVSPLPAAITVDAPHTTRTLLFLYGLALITSFVIYFVHTKVTSKALLAVIAIVLLIEPGLYIKDYFYDYPKAHDSSWLVNLDEIFIETKSLDNQYVVTNYPSSPYIYLLWYQKLLPSNYLSEIEYYPIDNANLEHVKRIGNYRFILLPEDKEGNEILVDIDESNTFSIVN